MINRGEIRAHSGRILAIVTPIAIMVVSAPPTILFGPILSLANPVIRKNESL